MLRVFLISSIHVSCPFPFIFHNSIALIIFGDKHKFYFLLLPHFLGPNIPLSTPQFSLVLWWGGVGWDWVHLVTSATVWPIVPTPDDRWWWWLCSNQWNAKWQGKPKYSEKTCPSATFSTTNPTLPDLGSNPCRHCGKPATNRLSYGTATPV
jgi:hypothetical protein